MNDAVDVMIDGQKIARTVKQRTEALATLGESERIYEKMIRILLPIFGGVLGGLLAGQHASIPPVISVLCGVGCVGAISALIECARLRRRLDAAVTLLQLNERKE